jgi:hypothetical protein
MGRLESSFNDRPHNQSRGGVGRLGSEALIGRRLQQRD